jgi:uncharacterized protein (TIGR00255 family)
MAINKPLMLAYYEDLKSFADDAQINGGDYINAIMRIPDVLKPESTELNEEEWASLFAMIKEAYHKFDTYRKLEGDKLAGEFHQRIDTILKNRLSLQDPISARNQRVRDKLKTNLEELIPIDKIDPNRFEQELIYYLERLDISEEYHRLETNCHHFTDELKSESQGKKLGFIAQEIGREVNTIGSKANDADMQRIVVIMKDELEKIKEQINNVL